MSTFTWQERTDGVAFVASVEGKLVPVDAWALVADLETGDGRKSRTFPLLAFRDAGVAVEAADGTELQVPWAALASLRPSELAGLGLPPASPHTLKIDKKGLVTDPDFRVVGTLVSGTGLPLIGALRKGALLTVGARRYIVLNPTFAALDAIDHLAVATDFDQRGDWLATLQDALPPDALADPYLRTIRVARADSFTVLPLRLDNGEVSFKVIPARARSGEGREALSHGPSEPVRVLPEAREDDWNRYLDQLKGTSRSCWSVGAGHYLVASDELRTALPVVSHVRSASEPERLAFLRNPRSYLRACLGDEFTEEGVEALFWESGEYGARVREIGVWQPKVLPWIRRRPEQWLPEAMGLRIGDAVVEYGPDELLALRSLLSDAVSRGELQVEFGGHTIPASRESLEAVEQLIQEHEKIEEGKEGPEARQKIAVLIEDNLELLKFSRPKRPVAGVVGAVPACLGTSLFSFQLEGYRWLQSLWATGASGGLLADDMGLGKTVQALAFLGWVRQEQANQSQRRPILVVGPTGLLRNWKAEHDKHLLGEGLGDCVELHGEGLKGFRQGANREHELGTGLPLLDVLRIQDVDWALTTYETLRDYQHSFAKVRWSVVVFDEAQKIKNPAALMTDAAKALEAQFVLTMTGTPVENHLSDLWTIVDTAQPGRLGTLKDYLQKYDSERDDSNSMLADLKRQLTESDEPSLMMRRMKEQCLTGLPTISITVSDTLMPPEQAEAYDEVVRRARKEQAGKGGMLSTLQSLRAVSLHPDTDFGGSDSEFIRFSARLSQTITILDEVRRFGEKALIFVESMAMQSVLGELLQRRYSLHAPPAVINGSVAGYKRKGRVDDFCARSGFDVMILSPRAGGVGLTITAANHVIHLSRWWNPAVEDQATDRVYRIGQDRPVRVYVPMAVHPVHRDASFDVRLDALLRRKRSLSRGLLAPPTASDRDLNQLYNETVTNG